MSRSGFAPTSRRAAVMKAVEGYRFNARRLRSFGVLEAWYLHTYPGRDNPVYQFDPKTKAVFAKKRLPRLSIRPARRCCLSLVVATWMEDGGFLRNHRY